MKICWDNLEKIKYNPNQDYWVDKSRNRFFYRESCKNCGEDFLGNKTSIFCSYSCSQSGKFNNFYGKKRPNHSKRMAGKNNPMYGIKLIGDKNGNYGKGDKIRGSNHYNWKGGYRSKNIPIYDTFAQQISYCEKVRRNKQDINILEVKCAYCGKWYIPKQTDVEKRIQTLKGNLPGEQRLYCSDNCKQECPIYRQHKYPKGFKLATSREVQPELRQLVLARDNYTCQKCGLHQNDLETGLHCHHITGVKQNPIESADMDNCITLCKNCHEWVHKQDGCKYYELRCVGDENG